MGFNPRAREGRDFMQTWFACLGSCFNPRAREGRDDHNLDGLADLCEFQPTRPRGARHYNPTKLVDFLLSFNPRAREGRDQLEFDE